MTTVLIKDKLVMLTVATVKNHSRMKYLKPYMSAYGDKFVRNLIWALLYCSDLLFNPIWID